MPTKTMRLAWLKKYSLLMFNQVDSTNTEALILAKSGVIGNFVIWAREQTGGRGRQGKHWESLTGNLHFSILLENPSSLSDCPQLSFVAANAVLDAIRMLALDKKLDLNLKLKWPNDVLINGKKVAGILLEAINIYGKSYVVVGIGVNVASYPENVDKPATSLHKEGVNNISSFWHGLRLLQTPLQRIYDTIAHWRALKPFALLNQYL